MAGQAQLAFWDGRNDEAITGYQRALSYQPRDVASRVGLAQVYRATGRQLEAMAQADSAVMLAPGNRDAQWAQVDLSRTTGAAVDVTLGWSDDSDRNEMWWQLVSASTQAANRTRVFGSVGAYEGSSVPSVRAARGTGSSARPTRRRAGS